MCGLHALKKRRFLKNSVNERAFGVQAWDIVAGMTRSEYDGFFDKKSTRGESQVRHASGRKECCWKEEWYELEEKGKYELHVSIGGRVECFKANEYLRNNGVEYTWRWWMDSGTPYEEKGGMKVENGKVKGYERGRRKQNQSDLECFSIVFKQYLGDTIKEDQSIDLDEIDPKSKWLEYNDEPILDEEDLDILEECGYGDEFIS
ncbi:hypothetical protein KI387_023936 [Taxus chinensis]|uniref:Uncharacterized protein n=1 Tax=Taxus chinensis TaxID=29808 RepID=A0AA38G2F9_TAXCH|nr:hypothetical protein KI387_023936 [Taxus chinensis]